jgi:hypothetical protein
MVKRNRKIKDKCSHCGCILNKAIRINKIISDADESLERFYNKNIRKKK